MRKLMALFVATLSFLLTTTASGEHADTQAPTKINAQRMVYDDSKQVNTFIGNVRLTRGTLIMKGNKMVIHQDPSGFQYGTLYGRDGELAFFRQKREGEGDLWVEGYAERIEYDSKLEVSKLFYRAKLLRLDGKKVIDEVNGNYISYDSKTEIYTVTNTVEGDPKSKGERIKVILPPRDVDKQKTPTVIGKPPVNSTFSKGH